MDASRPAVLRPGDWVSYDGRDHEVVALTGTTVRLRSNESVESVVLASYLLASPTFALIEAGPRPQMEPFGLLDALPEQVRAAARDWQRHIHEVETGLALGAAAGASPRPQYDLAKTTLRQREIAKAGELEVSWRTVARMRARYASQGLWGLVDQRDARRLNGIGRADPRLVAVAREVIAAETETSTGTRSRLIRRVSAQVEATHGAGVVPLPGKTAFYELLNTLAAGQHTFGSAVSRRQTANRPAGMFTPSFAARPGEQVQVDSTPLDVLVELEDGLSARAELTAAVDVATRTICAAVLRPAGTKAVDASLLLARMLVPEPMRPGWAEALKLSASRLPHGRLLDVDARMAAAAARPAIVPDTIVIDHGKVFVSETFTRACERLGISVQPARPGTPTDKAIVETTLGSINTLFAQHVAGYTGPNVTRRGADVAAAWTLGELQDLLDEWLIAGWAHRPHDALRDPAFPSRLVSPNDRYAALVAAAGYLPLTLSGQDYLELLPVSWRAINAYGIRINYRTYDSPELGPWRGQHSGIAAKRGLWEVHHDPYDLAQVFVRTPDGWVTAPWTHLPMLDAPFADFTWRHARRLAAEAGRDDTDETELARVLNDLLTRAQNGPGERASAKVAARTRVGAGTHRPPRAKPAAETPAETAQPAREQERVAAVIPLGVFDVDAEAEKWR
jgi:transposase InsO family protein